MKVVLFRVFILVFVVVSLDACYFHAKIEKLSPDPSSTEPPITTPTLTPSPSAGQPNMSGINLTTPSSSPNKISSINIRVEGLSEGDFVEMFSDLLCLNKIASDQTSPGNSNLDFNFILTSSGTYYYFVKVTPTNGVPSECSQSFATYELDIDPPSTQNTLIGLQSPSTSPSNFNDPMFRINYLSPDVSQIELFSDSLCTLSVAQVHFTMGATILDTRLSTPLASPGSYNIYYKVGDALNNFSICSSQFVNYQYDNVSPSAPNALTLLFPNSSPANDTTPTVRVSGVVSGDTVQLFTNSTCTIQVASAVTSGTYIDITTTPLTEANFTFFSRSVDPAGNNSICSTSSVNYSLDTTNPIAPSNFWDGDLLLNLSEAPPFSWNTASDSGSGLQSYQLAIGDVSGGTNILDWADVGLTLNTTLQSLSLTESKRYYASVRALDSAGNVSSVKNGDGWWSLAKKKIALDTTTPLPRAAIHTPHFADSVAISEDGTTMVVGAFGDSLDGNQGNFIYQAGAAFVYIKSGPTWELQQKLVAFGTNGRNEGDGYGVSVAISGDTIVVGAQYHSYDELGGNFVNYAGAAYVYTRTGGVWSPQQKLVGFGVNGRVNEDFFGNSVAISNDTIAVGAKNQDFDATGANELVEAGATFVFKRSLGVWSAEQKIVGTGINGRVGSDYFGEALVLSGDTLAIGASNQDYNGTGLSLINDAGAVYIFTRSLGVWSIQQKIVGFGTNGRKTNDYFGSSLSFSNETLVVGAHNHSYDENGANYVYGAGAVYVFTRSGGVWSPQQKLAAFNANPRENIDSFGIGVAISNDTLVVGAMYHSNDETGANSVSQTGAAFVFIRNTGVWSAQQKLVAQGYNARNLSDFFGESVAIHNDMALIGSNNAYDSIGLHPHDSAGAVFAFSRNVNAWSQTQKIVDDSTPQPRMDQYLHEFGRAIAVSEDGQTLVVGSKDSTDENGLNFLDSAGAVFVYVKSGGNWVLQQKLVGFGPNGRMINDQFGKRVAISIDTIAVGATGQQYDESGVNILSDAGAVYIFTRSGGVWTPQQKLTGFGLNGRVVGDSFGDDLAISGETVAVGSKNSYDESGANSANSAGAVYVFTRTGSVWSPQQKLVAFGTNSREWDDVFGYQLDIDGNTLVVSSQNGNDVSGANYLSYAGNAFVFTRTGSVWSPQQRLTGFGTWPRNSWDFFGSDVAISGETLVVSATQNGDDIDGNNFVINAGAVFVFNRSGGVWSSGQKLLAFGTNGRKAFDSFGSSVSLSHDLLVVSSRNQDYDSSGANYVSNAGAAYVFTRNNATWTGVQKLSGYETNGRMTDDYFGDAVSCKTNVGYDGYTIFINALDQDYNSSGAVPIRDAGAVFVFY